MQTTLMQPPLNKKDKAAFLDLLDEKIKRLELKAAKNSLLEFAKLVYPNYTVGAHHKVMARVFKDVFPRYKTMKGYHVPRKAGWDTHGFNNTRMFPIIEQRHLPITDQTLPTLLTDLDERGLLDQTLVVWMGEFGRTPVVELPTPGANAGKINGRDHNHHGFTCWLAGGGVKGGYVHGATDEFGFKAVEKPVGVHDLHATMLHLLGFDHEKLTYRYAGRDFRLTDIHGEVVKELLS